MIYWLVSYPRSGNTWCRAFLTNLLHSDGRCSATIGRLAVPPTPADRDAFDEFLDFDSSDMTTAEIDTLRREFYRGLARESPPRLLLKLHCAWRLASDGMPVFPADLAARAILIVRNPLDVAVSLAHFFGWDLDTTIDWMEADTASLGAQVTNCSPALPQNIMSWTSHTLSWLDQSACPVHLVRYEDLVRDPELQFTRMARFIEVSADDPAIADAIRRSRFEELQRQEEQNGFHLQPSRSHPFFRSGRAGQWQEVLSAAQVARIKAAHGPTMSRLGYLEQLSISRGI